MKADLIHAHGTKENDIRFQQEFSTEKLSNFSTTEIFQPYKCRRPSRGEHYITNAWI